MSNRPGTRGAFRLPSPVLNSLFIGLILLLCAGSRGLAQVELGSAVEERVFYLNEWRNTAATGITYAAPFERFFVVEQPGPSTQGATLFAFTPHEDPLGAVELTADIADSGGIAFDATTNRLLWLNRAATELVQVALSPDGMPDLSSERRLPLAAFGIQRAQGMTFDASTHTLLVLDTGNARIVSLGMADGSEGQLPGAIALPANLNPAALRGLAIDQRTGHLFTLDHAGQVVHELDASGAAVAAYALSQFGFGQVRDLLIAPSSDPTDEPEMMRLYVVGVDASDATAAANTLYLPLIAGEEGAATIAAANGASSRIVELTLLQHGAQPDVSVNAAAAIPLFLVQTVETSAFDPPSPDPSGIDYSAQSDILLISDGEVEEMPNLFEDANMFGVARASMNLAYTYSTTDYSDEPTDVAFNPNNGHIFTCDDDSDRIYEAAPGPDGTVGTNDDVITSFSTKSFGSSDPEGLTYDPGSNSLYIADGSSNEVYRVNAGANGVFDGVPSAGGDDVVTNFDTRALGISDPEGIFYDPPTGILYMTGSSKTLIYAVSTSGALLQTYDISAANARKPAGLAIGPSSFNSSIRSIYIVDRGVDNNSDPDENDGKMYEFTTDEAAPPPTATATRTPTTTSTSTPTDTPTGTLTPSSTPTETPTGTPTDTPTGTLTPSSTPTDTPTGTLTPSSTPTYTPTGTLTPSSTPTDTPTGTLTPSSTPTQTPTGTLTPTSTPVTGGGALDIIHYFPFVISGE